MVAKPVKVENGAEAYLELLRIMGVKYFFMNPGTDSSPLNDIFVKFQTEGKNDPELVLVPHENTATSMAYGYAMVSGEPQVVMVHVTVGTANALGALINAERGRIPIVLTAGRSPITEEGLPGSRTLRTHWEQESYDQGSIVREFVKWDYELRTCEQIPTVVFRAFKIASTEPKGPVYLTLPREWLMKKVSKVEIPPVSRFKPSSPPGPDHQRLEKAAEILVDADEPLIITGYLGRNPEAVSTLVDFAELLAIPVIEYPRMRMNFPTENPLHLGFDTQPYIEKADVILIIDTNIPWIPRFSKPNDQAKIIQIAIDPNYTSIPIWGFPVDLPITSDSNMALSSLITYVKKTLKKPSNNKAISERRRKIAREHSRQRDLWKKAANTVKNDKPIDFQWLSHIINEVKDEDTIIINEFSLQPTQIKQNTPGTYFMTPSSSSLGLGLGSALGAKLAAPDRTVIACLGDGSYIFSNPTACHWTAMVYEIPILTVIFNNACYGAVRRSIQRLFPNGWSVRNKKFLGTDLDPPPKFAEIAEANGGYGETVEDPSNIKAALIRGLDKVRKEHKQALVDVICKKP